MLLSERWGSTDTSRHLLGKLMAAVARPCLAICWNPLRSSEMGASLWLGQAALVVDMPSCTDGSKSSTWQTQHCSNISWYTNQTHGSWCSPLACRIELEPTTITFRRRMVDFWPHVRSRQMKSRRYDFDATIRQQLDLQIFHLKLPCQPRGYMHLDVDVVAWSSLTCIWWYTLFALSVHKRLGNGKEGLDFEHKFCCHISYHRTAKD